MWQVSRGQCRSPRKTWSVPSVCWVVGHRLGSCLLHARAPHKRRVLGEGTRWDGEEAAAAPAVAIKLASAFQPPRFLGSGRNVRCTGACPLEGHSRKTSPGPHFPRRAPPLFQRQRGSLRESASPPPPLQLPVSLTLLLEWLSCEVCPFSSPPQCVMTITT